MSVPCFGEDPWTFTELAHLAEQAGWDGFFLWDHVLFLPDQEIPILDPWVTLAMVVHATARIRVGALVTAVPRRRPWKLARETVSVDRASGGRLILGAGLGWPIEGDFEPFGEPSNVGTRAQMLDEGLEVLTGLWSGRPFAYSGRHYQIGECTFVPVPTQEPRIPIWVAGTFPIEGPIRRAARWDGMVPLKFDREGTPAQMTPDDVADLGDRISQHRGSTHGFDLAISGETSTLDPAAVAPMLETYASAGATWWIESTPGFPGWESEMTKRIEAGPPQPFEETPAY